MSVGIKGTRPAARSYSLLSVLQVVRRSAVVPQSQSQQSQGQWDDDVPSPIPPVEVERRQRKGDTLSLAGMRLGSSVREDGPGRDQVEERGRGRKKFQKSTPPNLGPTERPVA